MSKIRATVAWMGGGRIDGYYYVRIEGTDLVACNDGHPDFLTRFKEFSKNRDDLKRDAQKCANKINRQLRSIK